MNKVTKHPTLKTDPVTDQQNLEGSEPSDYVL